MDRIWQLAWDRYKSRYSWACWALTLPLALPVYLAWSLGIVALERSDRYAEAAAMTVVAVLAYLYVMVAPGGRDTRLIERWAAGDDVDRESAMRATYSYGRKVIARGLVVTGVCVAALFGGVGMVAGASGPRLIQYAILGAIAGTAGQLITVHSYVEATLRPARAAIAGDTEIGDSLPRSRPTFATWTNVAMLAVGFAFAVAGAVLGAVFDVATHGPALAIVHRWCTGARHRAVALGRVLATPATHSRSRPQELNVLRPVTSANACRWCKTTTSVRWRRRSTACRRV